MSGLDVHHPFLVCTHTILVMVLHTHAYNISNQPASFNICRKRKVFAFFKKLLWSSSSSSVGGKNETSSSLLTTFCCFPQHLSSRSRKSWTTTTTPILRKAALLCLADVSLSISSVCSNLFPSVSSSYLELSIRHPPSHPNTAAPAFVFLIRTIYFCHSP